MSKGVEWALHSCLLLVWLEPRVSVPVSRLAGFHGLPVEYFHKQVQALVRAGLVASSSGPRGGVHLARHSADISLMDVVTAIEGTEQAFVCTEIHRRGSPDSPPDTEVPPCTIALAMGRAELAWRQALAAQSIADMAERVARTSPDFPDRARRWMTG